MLRGKNAVITGMRRGIGRTTVEAFAKNGANVWACARKEDADFETDMTELAEKYGVWIRPVYFEMTDEGEMKEAFRKIQSEKMPVDVLVNNAGIASESRSFLMTTVAQMREIFEVNFFSQMLFTKYIVRLMMRQRKGSIVNISSIAALDGQPTQLEYVGSKAALVGATRHLAIVLGKMGIRVNAVAPGIIDTDGGNQMPSEVMEQILEKSVMKRLGFPQEISNVIAFLASDLASYMTGQVIRVDGGL